MGSLINLAPFGSLVLFKEDQFRRNARETVGRSSRHFVPGYDRTSLRNRELSVSVRSSGNGGVKPRGEQPLFLDRTYEEKYETNSFY
jgi:hypothetical protein